jgi:DNA mismatch repair protein MutS
MSDNQLTPMFLQYYTIKEAHKDTILFFRLGDFYEMFGEDAQVGAEELELTLTSREAGKGRRIPMAGIPYHAADSYIARLVEKGYKVAICEQVEDPATAKGLVERDVVRIVTPGTITDPSALPDKSNNYLAAIMAGDKAWGFGYVDISTGEFAVTEIRGKDARERLLDEVARIRPSECLLHASLDEDADLIAFIERLGKKSITWCQENKFVRNKAYGQLTEHFGTKSLEGFGCEKLPLAIGAAGALLGYLQETQKATLGNVTGLSTYSTSKYMILDSATRRNLELTETIREGDKKRSLLAVLDRTVTAMGGRKLRKWIDQPLLEPGDIQMRLDAVDEFFADTLLRGTLREVCKDIYDIERLISKIALGSANARDLQALKASLMVLPKVKAELCGVTSGRLVQLRDSMDELGDVAELIDRSITEDPPVSVREGNLIRTGYSREVDELREIMGGGKRWIASLEEDERGRTGIKSLKVGFNRVFGYYIEVTKANLELVPQNYIRKQTLSNSERFITPELKEWEDKILGAEERIIELEYQLFTEIRKRVGGQVARVQRSAEVIAELDVLLSFAEVAVENNYVRPEIVNDGTLLIKDGRHPVVEKLKTGGAFVPNDLYLDGDEDSLIILTGPNMAGKSTFGKTCLLIQIMAQCGSFVPASLARLSPVDRVFVRAGSSEDITGGYSTFMVELLETANILTSATSRSLVFIDELGRGTSTYDGMAIAQAVIEYIHDKIGARTIVATHYHELVALENKFKGVRNFHVTAIERDGELIFLYKVLPGGTDKSYGINVARMAGIPRAVIQRAKAIQKDLEASSPSRPQQISIFTSVEDSSDRTSGQGQLIGAIENLKVDEMSPMEALQKLYELKGILEAEKEENRVGKGGD